MLTVRAEVKTYGNVDSLLSVSCNETLKQPVVVLVVLRGSQIPRRI